MKKTALQQLIDEAEKTLYGSQLRWLRTKATELLETEREQIEEAYTEGEIHVVSVLKEAFPKLDFSAADYQINLIKEKGDTNVNAQQYYEDTYKCG